MSQVCKAFNILRVFTRARTNVMVTRTHLAFCFDPQPDATGPSILK